VPVQLVCLHVLSLKFPESLVDASRGHVWFQVLRCSPNDGQGGFRFSVNVRGASA